jgi:hypothetical protein
MFSPVEAVKLQLIAHSSREADAKSRPQRARGPKQPLRQKAVAIFRKMQAGIFCCVPPTDAALRWQLVVREPTGNCVASAVKTTMHSITDKINGIR